MSVVQSEGVVTCKKCGEEKPVGEFRLYKSRGRTLRRGTCQKCENKGNDERYHAGPDYWVSWRQRNRDKINKVMKRYYGRHRQRVLDRARMSGFRDRRKRRYGLTEAQFLEICEKQGNACLVCLGPLVRPHVDHDHTCCPGEKSCGECIRGVLCNVCNMALGLLKDSPEILRKAADYIEGHRDRREL